MDLHPWKLWSLDGRPTEGTEEILAVLESVLRRDPNHIGANHYYIHATEASPHAEWALASARRLETVVPAAGHLVHMPARTYTRIGDYSAAAHSNASGSEADRAYLRESGTTGSMYDMMYFATVFTSSQPATAWKGISPTQSRLLLSWLHMSPPCFTTCPWLKSTCLPQSSCSLDSTVGKKS
jgi:hypothetical protein